MVMLLYFEHLNPRFLKCQVLQVQAASVVLSGEMVVVLH